MATTKRWLRIAITAFVLVGPMMRAPAAAAHGDEESIEATELVRQAIALIVSTPDDMEAIEDKVVDALEAEDQEGVDLDGVRAAQRALEGDDLHEARNQLEQSIGARPHLGGEEPAPINEVAAPRGEDPGEAPIQDPLDTSAVDGGDVAAAVLGAALLAIGVLLAYRWRPERVVAR